MLLTNKLRSGRIGWFAIDNMGGIGGFAWEWVLPIFLLGGCSNGGAHAFFFHRQFNAPIHRQEELTGGKDSAFDQNWTPAQRPLNLKLLTLGVFVKGCMILYFIVLQANVFCIGQLDEIQPEDKFSLEFRSIGSLASY